MSDKPKSASPYQLDCANIHWREGDIPEARNYQDIYFSRQHGLEETEYVFLQHNQLQQRWQQLDANKPGIFTIAETGFGTGLNFLAAWRLWQQVAPASWYLCFISVEKHPLRHHDLQRALNAWPQLQQQSAELLANYPVLIPGHHRIDFEGASLQLYLGDAINGFNQCLDSDHPQFAAKNGPKVDAWFLDGFAPAKNPDMWCDDLFRVIGQLSKPGTSCATFTAAGIVRRGLQSVGFDIEKVSGYGSKREMVRGVFLQQTETEKRFSRKGIKAPWALPPKPQNTQRQASVIGGGMAGATIAYALAKRGWHVTLLERHNDIAQEASGNPQGILYTKLSHQAGLLNQFTLHSYLYATRFYRQLAKTGLLQSDSFDFCGMLQLACSEKERQQLERLQNTFSAHPDLAKFLSAEQASHIAGLSIDCPSLLFPQAGWIKPRLLCKQLLNHPNINLQLHSDIVSLQQEKNTWLLHDQQNQLLSRSDIVVIANSRDAQQFEQTRNLPFKAIRGQITVMPEQVSGLKTVLCHEGYISPASDNQYCLGATFDNNDHETAVRGIDHQRNLQSLQQAVPAFFPDGIEAISPEQLSGRVSFRCTSPDYLPMIGPVPQLEQFEQDYALLKKNAHSDIPVAGSYYPGLYINAGFGSRGLSAAPLCSEYLASLISHEPRPIGLELATALSPGRFKIREICRNK
jgi:tRNA 5-methylaminomethyl-2-thiouridine biosynthesis bifunctional protein